MLRHIIFTVLLSILIFEAGAHSTDLTKCNPELVYIYDYYYDTVTFKAKADSFINFHLYKSLKSAPAVDSSFIIDSIPRKIVPPLDSFKINKSSLHFIDSVPYVSPRIKYHGDTTDLRELGVKIHHRFGGSISSLFPLSILPRVDSLPTVESIRGCIPHQIGLRPPHKIDYLRNSKSVKTSSN